MARKLFQLVGQVALDGAVNVNKQLTAIDKKAAKASKEFVKLGKKVSNIGMGMTKAVTGPLLAVGGAMLFAAEKTGQYADSILDLKAITGLSTDSLQEFENVAREAGVDFTKLTKTISMFSSKLPIIAKGSGPAYDAIQRLGVSINDTEGNVRNMNELFPEMINKLQAIENVTDRNSIAQQIFGARLDALGPVLGMTAEEMENARKEAHELGIVMSEDALDAANEYRKESEKLRAEFTAFWRNIAMKVIPILKDDLAPFLRETMVPLFEALFDKISKGIKWFSSLSEETKENTIKLIALAAVMGPVLLIVGKLIIGIRSLKAVVLLLNSALRANPFALAALAIAGIALAIDKTGKAWKKWSDELGKDIAQKQTNALKNNLEAIIPLYGELVAMSSRGILNKEDAERFALLSEEVKNAETNIADLGTALEGGLVARMNQAENQLTDMNEELALASESTDEYTESTEAATVATKDLTAEEKKRAEALRKTREAEAQANLDYFHSLDEQIKDAKEKAKEQLEKQKEEQQSYYDGVIRLALEAQADKLDLLHLEEDDAMAAAERMLANTEKLESAKQAIRETYAKKREDLESQTQDKIDNVGRAGNAIEKILSDDRVQMAIGAIYQIAEIQRMYTENRMMEIEEKYSKEKEAVRQSTMNEAEKTDAIKKIDKKADKEKLKLKKEQAKRDKKQAIFGAIINTALSIGSALTMKPPPLGIAFAIIMGILGAAQIAAIASQPLPFADGGFIKSGRGGVQGLVGEGKEDEIIFPLKTGVMHLADALVGKLAEISNVRPGAALAVAGGGGGRVTHETHLHIGTFIGDKAGLKELERQLIPIRVAEEQRKGDER